MLKLLDKNRQKEQDIIDKETKAREKQNERDRIDRQNQVDSEILQARLNNLKEGSEEYYDVQREIEDEQHQQYLEDLRRRLEDGLLTKEEYKQLELEAEKNHQCK